MPSLFVYYVLRGEKRHDRTQEPVALLGLWPTADLNASCRIQDTGVQGNDEQNSQCRHKYTLIQTSFEMTKSSIGSLEITVDWRRVSWRMANSYKRRNKGIYEHFFKNLPDMCLLQPVHNAVKCFSQSIRHTTASFFSRWKTYRSVHDARFYCNYK